MNRKFMTGILLILIPVLALSIFINRNVIEKYYLYQEKKEINRVCDLLTGEEVLTDERIREVEDAEDVVIALVRNSTDNDLLNERLRKAFSEKGVGLQKYWLWEQDQQHAMNNGRRLRLYHQEKLHYSLLVAYMTCGEDFVAVAKIIPSVTATLSMVNRITALIFIAAGGIMLLLILFLVRKITRPLNIISEAANAIAESDFQTISIQTGDELEILAEDINRMSRQLQETQQKLIEKNRQMEELLSDVSHDLKTPVALIKAYTCAMKDGMDDGTFLDTVIAQNNRIEQMIERLLSLSRAKRQEKAWEKVNLSACLEEEIRSYRIQEEVLFECMIQPSVIVNGSTETVTAIFSNLISNAVKYSAGGVIRAALEIRVDHPVFTIENRIQPETAPDPERIWQPFYVAESSRNKAKSGTGLGLAIVRASADQYGYQCSCQTEDGRILFQIIF